LFLPTRDFRVPPLGQVTPTGSVLFRTEHPPPRMGNWFSHHLPRPVSREGICTCRQLPGRWMVSLLFRGRDALADDPPC
ncbi:hypothetical protein T12_2718, partial [Trichinella patagoniensis]